MNNVILNQYNLHFYKTKSGVFSCKSGPNGQLAIYIEIFKQSDIVQLIIDDIDLALNGNYNQIIAPEWNGELGLDTYFGTILSNSTFEIWYEHSAPSTATILPLTDFKEILISWKEWLNT